MLNRWLTKVLLWNICAFVSHWSNFQYVLTIEKLSIYWNRIQSKISLSVLIICNSDLSKDQTKISSHLLTLMNINYVIKYFAFTLPLEQLTLCFDQGILKGKYHCTINLLFDWLWLVCFANKNKNCQLSYNLFQTSQTGGQWYSDTSPLVFPGQADHQWVRGTWLAWQIINYQK